MNINFTNLVRQLAPPHKRQPLRLAFLRAFVTPLGQLFTDFDAWRKDTRMLVNVNSQVIVLEGYLQQKYHEPITIKIVTYADGLLDVGFEEEGEAMMPHIGMIDTETPVDVPFEGEIRMMFGDVDFIVYIPPGLNIDLIRADIEKYKRASKRFKIITGT